MIATKPRKLFVVAGLCALFASSSAFAGFFSHVIMSQSFYSGTVSVPATASCQQFAAAYWYGNSPNQSFTICNGPLGSFSLAGDGSLQGRSISVSGTIAPGDYNIYEWTSWGGSGYSGVNISW